MVVITWDTVVKFGTPTFLNGNLTVSLPNGTSKTKATIGRTTGKWYWEVFIDAKGLSMIGIININGLTLGNTSVDIRYYYANGVKYPEATPYAEAYATGDTIGIALDLDIGTIEFYKNGVSQGVSHTNIKDMGEVFPTQASGGTATTTTTANFGATPFKYDIPIGYYSYDGSQYGSTDKILLSSGNKKVSTVKSDIGGDSLDSEYIGTNITLSNSNKTAYILGMKTVVGSVPINKGKRYWEVAVDAGNNTCIGLIKDGEDLSLQATNKQSSKWYMMGGQKNSTASEAYASAYTTGDVISVLLNMDEGSVEFWKNGVSQGVAYRDLTSLGNVRPSATRGSTTGNATSTFRFSEDEFSYSVPSGFLPYSVTKNSLKSVSTQSEQSFINHGMSQSELSSIDMSSEFAEKHYIQDTITPLGEGKVFKHELDIDKVIKKIKMK